MVAVTATWLVALPGAKSNLNFKSKLKMKSTKESE